MAQPSYIEALLGGLDAGVKRALKLVFEYVLTNLRFGRPEERQRAENIQAYYYSATTAATANQEFAIAHALGRAPYLVLPVLSLQDVGAKLVPLTVTKAADESHVYLSSSVTNAPITVLVEG
jgi:hypothetical protein